MEIYIVDKDDNELCTKQIEDVDWPNDIYRVSSVWLFNDKGEVLSAQRGFNKEQSPGTWGPSAAGIVESHESYEENVLNETEEELGITLSSEQLVLGPKLFTKNTDPDRQYFLQWFFAKYNGTIEDLEMQEDEVAALKWIPRETLITSTLNDPKQYCDVLPDVIKLIAST